MFNKSKVISALIGLVGFEQPIDPDYQFLNAANLVQVSGRAFTQNSFCKIKWLVDNNDYDEATDEQLNEQLKALADAAITTVLDKVFDRPDYLDRQVLYQNANNKTEVEALPLGFVGYRIQQGLKKNWAFEITRCFLEFKNVGTNVTLLLYSTAHNAPIFSEQVNVVSENQEVQLNWRLDNTLGNYKGEYYFGYLTNAVTLQPIKRQWQKSNQISVITGLSFNPIQALYTPSTTAIFDLDIIEGVSECWGLNPDVTVFKDATDLIIQNSFLFAKAIQMQGQINFMSSYLASSRSNIEQRLSKEAISSILTEIEGIADTNKIGLKRELTQELSTLRKEITRLQDGYFATGYLLNTLS